MTQQPSTNKLRANRVTFYIMLALAGVTLVLFRPVLGFQFLNYDDNVFVTENPMVLGGLTWGGVREAFLTAPADYWRPLSWVSHMLDVELFGLDAGAHHLTNVLIHALNSVLLFLALLRLTGRQWPSAIVAALFAWHPLHVESVAWIAERKDVLCATFWFLTLLAYERYARNPSVKSYSMVLGCFILGLMSKPMIVTLPFALLLLDYWPLGRFRRKATPGEPLARTWLRLGLEKLPMLLLAAAASVSAFLKARELGALYPTETFPLGARITNSLVAYEEYIERMFWPADLAILYPLPASWAVGRVIVAGAIVAFVTLAVVIWVKKRPFIAVGWLWFLGTLVPVIGLVQVGAQFIADRYTYIPLIGLFMAIVWTTDEILAARHSLRAPAIALVTVLLVACAAGTTMQLRYWRDNMSVFGHAVQVTSGNVIAHNNLGSELAREQRFEEAAHHYGEALRIGQGQWNEPWRVGDKIKILYNLALVRSEQGRRDEAASLYSRVLEENPNHAGAHVNLGNLLVDQGKLTNAIVHYETALRVQPRDADAHFNFANVLADLGRAAEAQQHYAAAVQFNPGHFRARYNLGNILAAQGKMTEAVTQFQAVVGLQPDYAPARFNLGAVLFQMNRAAEAAEQFQAGLKLDANSIEGHYNLAQSLVQLGRTNEAREHLEAARQLQATKAKQK